MKLKDIDAALESADYQHILDGETEQEYIQRSFTSLPKVQYKDLPASLKKDIRETFPPQVMREFLVRSYEERLQSYSDMPPEDIKHFEELLYAKLTEAFSFEWHIANIPESDIDKILVTTRNSATYVVRHGERNKYVLDLYSFYAIDAFETALANYRSAKAERQQKDGEPEKRPPKPQDLKQHLVTAGFYQSLISDKKFQGALSTQKNQNAYIALMDPDFFKRLNFENGTITFDDETAGIVKQYSKGKYTDIQDLDFPLLQQIYTAAVKSNIRHDAFTITVSLPQFFREMKIEVAKGNAPDIMGKLHSFENCVGIMPGTQTISKLFSILQLDAKNQTMTFAVPYIMRLFEALEEKNHVERKTRQGELVDYLQPHHNNLVHSSIVSERNKTAVELVYLITNGLLQRGYVPDIETYRKKGAKTKFPERVTYSITFRSLINDAPLLRGRIKSYKQVSNQNNALRRAFEKAYQLIDKKTDAAAWFIDLQGNRIIPTMTTLDKELTFTHNGRNADYKPRK